MIPDGHEVVGYKTVVSPVTGLQYEVALIAPVIQSDAHVADWLKWNENKDRARVRAKRIKAKALRLSTFENRKLLARYEAGEKIKDLAAGRKLSTARVYELLKRERLARE